MLAIFLDVENELRSIADEYAAMQRKLKRFEETADAEDKDSHMRAIAGCIHGIYTGMEKILKDLVKYFDAEIPAGEDWHTQLLLRAKYPNKGARTAILSPDTFQKMNVLRGFRHVFRGGYHTNLIVELVMQRVHEALAVFPLFAEDVRRFLRVMETRIGQES